MMKLLHNLSSLRNGTPALRARNGKPFFEVCLAVLLVLAILCAGPRLARAQVQAPGDMGGFIVSVGGMGSGYSLQYGQRKMAGITAFVDADTKRRFGIEAEGRWLEFHQTANVHAETFSAGGRYHFDVARFEPYAKGLVGFGDFNFPYNYAYGRYVVVTAGGGLDFRWTRRITVRAVDFEYQDWPNFTFGNINSLGVNAGLRVRIF
jgi:hypothetical protein